MIHLATVELSSGSSSIDFTNLPESEDFIMYVKLQNNDNANQVYIQLNGRTGEEYNATFRDMVTGGSSYTDTGFQNYYKFKGAGRTADSSNDYWVGEIKFLQSASDSFNYRKIISFEGGITHENDTRANVFGMGLNASFTQATNRITFVNATYAAGCVVSLYQRVKS